jgi:hypothetical protein
MAEVRNHVQDEERNLLPRLSLAAGREETERMGTHAGHGEEDRADASAPVLAEDARGTS